MQRAKRLNRDDKAYLALILPSFAVLFALTLVPLAYSLWISMTNMKITSRTSAFIGLKNYQEVLSDANFWHSALVMMLQCVSEVTLQMLFGLAIALLLQREFRGVKVCRTLFIMPWSIAPVVAGLVWRMLFSTELGWVNYYLTRMGLERVNWLGNRFFANATVVMTNTWLTTPAVGIMLLAALQAIDQDYYDAAKIDGASSLQSLRYMVLPMIRPTMLLALLIRIMDAIRQFDITYTMTGGGPGNATESLNLYAYNVTFKYWRIGYGAALSMVMLAIILTAASMLLKAVQIDSD